MVWYRLPIPSSYSKILNSSNKYGVSSYHQKEMLDPLGHLLPPNW